MSTSDTDRIHKEITLTALPARVWRALTDPAEFGAWFGVRLAGEFRVGEDFEGPITHPGYEHLSLRAQVVSLEPERCFAFRWQPQAFDQSVDHSGEPTTLVEFRLEAAGTGTRLTVDESGFDGLPEKYRAESFLRNEGGWTAQTGNIARHVDG
ncbi:MAG TPA: SRPBCC family protein [Planctomycetota bacterium]